MSFADKVKTFAKKAKEANANIFRASVIQLFSNVVVSTPVDTGRLRGNWQTSIGTPIFTETERTLNPVSEIKEVVGNVEIDSSVYMRNNLPYVEVIEYDGHSAKAPEGMLRVNVAKWPRIVEAARRKFKI